MIDLHIHTSLSPDAKGSIDSNVKVAVQRGFKIIGFTEHWDLDRWELSKGFMIHKSSQEIIRNYNSGGRVEILFGAELAYNKPNEKYVKQFISEVNLDYILGSVHEVDGLNFSEIGEAGQYFERYGEKGFGIYLENLGRFADEGIYDVLAHLDIVKRFSKILGYPFKLEKYKSQIKEIVKTVIKRNRAIEINASGFRQPPAEPYPNLKVVEWFFDEGGKHLTIGSDSHDSNTLGNGCDIVISKLLEMGIVDLTIYRSRQPITFCII